MLNFIYLSKGPNEKVVLRATVSYNVAPVSNKKSGAVEVSKMRVWKLMMIILILRKINVLDQENVLNSGCSAAHPATPVPQHLKMIRKCLT